MRRSRPDPSARAHPIEALSVPCLPEWSSGPIAAPASAVGALFASAPSGVLPGGTCACSQKLRHGSPAEGGNNILYSIALSASLRVAWSRWRGYGMTNNGTPIDSASHIGRPLGVGRTMPLSIKQSTTWRRHALCPAGTQPHCKGCLIIECPQSVQ